jgi:hypothetical protein
METVKKKRIFTSLHMTVSTTKVFHVNNIICTYLATSTDSHYTDSTQHQNKQFFLYSTGSVNSYEKIYIFVIEIPITEGDNPVTAPVI